MRKSVGAINPAANTRKKRKYAGEMLDEKKRRNSRRKLLTTALNDSKDVKMAAVHRRTSFNKPRPPRPISKIPDLNPGSPVSKVKKVKPKSSDDSKSSKQNENTKNFRLNAPSDQINNNVKVKGLDLIRNGDFVETPQTPDRGKEDVQNHFYKTANCNNHISDINGFNLDDSPTKSVKTDSGNDSVTENEVVEKKKDYTDAPTFAHAQRYLPNKTISDIPGLSNLINEKLKMLALERNRKVCNEQTPSGQLSPTLSDISTSLTCDTPSDISTPTPSETPAPYEENPLSVNEVLDETFRRLSRKGLISNHNPPRRFSSDLRKNNSYRRKTDSSSSSDSTNVSSPTAATPTRPISNIPGLNPEQDLEIKNNWMKGLKTCDTKNNDRKGLLSSEEEIPVIEQLIQKKNSNKEMKDLTRPDLVPVDQKAKIYFLINHNEGKISHVIKSIKTNLKKQ